MNIATNLKTKESCNNGITLIALIITIIVLLIFAGISIAILTGDNGILSKANTAKEETSKASAEEKVKIAVYGSYDTTGNVNINELNSNLENVEGLTGRLPIERLPATVVVDGYSFLIGENGSVELAGPRPVVGEIKVTLKDGSAIPEDGTDEGTELKIEFTATMERGTITSISPQVPYITNGIDKQVKFTITGTVDEVTYKTEKTVNLKDYYKKTEFDAGDIAKEPTTFYGSVVDNYTVNTNASNSIKNAETTWRIFYAGKEPNGTEDNIYLIADDYIDYTQAPNGKEGTSITKNTTEYQLSFNDVYNDYNGGKWIWENSLAKNWLSKYFDYTPDEGVTYPNKEESTNENIKAVAYMMDTNVWNEYVGEKAKYAIGGPTIEMFCTSYKETHEESSIDYYVNSTVGYTFKDDKNLLSNYNKIYIREETDKDYGMWLASPSNEYSNSIVSAYYAGHLTYIYYGYDRYGMGLGFRPIVCLKTGIQLEKKSEGVYSIKN